MLTDAQCRNATCPPEKARLRLYDSGGLYLEVSPNGAKRWFWKFRKGTSDSRLALGRYPEIGLTAARKKRDAAKMQKADGIDPVQARKVEKLRERVAGDNTLETTGREWLELHRLEWSASHYVRERRNLEKDLFPYLGARDIGKIEPIELLAAIKRVEERGVSDVPHRVLMTAGGVWPMSWPKIQGRHSPAMG